MTSEKAVQVRADLVALTLAESVALSASCLEETSTLLCVTWMRSTVSNSSVNVLFAANSMKIKAPGPSRQNFSQMEQSFCFEL